MFNLAPAVVSYTFPIPNLKGRSITIPPSSDLKLHVLLNDNESLHFNIECISNNSSTIIFSSRVKNYYLAKNRISFYDGDGHLFAIDFPRFSREPSKLILFNKSLFQIIILKKFLITGNICKTVYRLVRKTFRGVQWEEPESCLSNVSVEVQRGYFYLSLLKGKF